MEPERANAVVDIAKYLKKGSVADLGRRHTIRVAAEGRESAVELGGVVIGEELGRQLGVSKGDVVTMVVPSVVGMVPRLKRFVVAGVFNSGMFEYDAGFVYMSLVDAQAILGLKDAVNEIRTDQIDEASRIAARFENQILKFPYEARDWMEMNRNVFLCSSPVRAGLP